MGLGLGLGLGAGLGAELAGNWVELGISGGAEEEGKGYMK